MTKHANCDVSIMFAKIVRVAVVVLVPALADPRQAAASSQKASHLVAPWAPMQRIQALVRLGAMHVLPSVKNALITLVHAMITSATEPKVHVRRVLPVIARKVTAHPSKTVALVLREIAHKVIVRLTRTVARAHREIARKATAHIKIAARVRPVRPMPTRLNSAAGMCLMVSIQAHA